MFMEVGKIGKKMMSDSKFFMGYSRWLADEKRYEIWDESIERVMDMHREKYSHIDNPKLEEFILEAQEAYRKQLVLGAQRALQFGGKQIFKHEGRLYNCSASHVDRMEFFQQAMYLLLCGCGVGFSVQRHHIAKLPEVQPRGKSAVTFTIPDSIEGWSDAFGILLSSFVKNKEESDYPKYHNKKVYFDFSQIRSKGAYISGGFKAPGPDGLRESLLKCESLLVEATKESNKISSIVAYDFVMHMADAVLSGGVRRSATICLFDKDDKEMMNAKTGDWFIHNPQRGRSNNSVVLVRDELTWEEWLEIMKSVKDYGEPGFVLTENKEFVFNPCVEIGMLPVTEDGRSGFQMCNLSEINGGKCTSKELFFEACRAGAILGTLQAGYTNFEYLGEATREIVEREALIGVSITGWMNNPDVLFDAETLEQGAKIVKDVNEELAKIIGINPAARTTCVKPSGNASVLLGTASGIHGEHAPRYFRNVQMNEMDGALELINSVNPFMVEDSVYSSNGTDKVVSFPIVSKEGSIYKDDLLGVKQLEYVKFAQRHWVNPGTRLEACTDKNLRHNVSNTITVDNWDEVTKYIFDNKEHFAGISLLAFGGDKAYNQAPFLEVPSANQILSKYGDASIFASGLIVDAMYAFNNDLWLACSTVQGFGIKVHESHSKDLLKRDWIRRAKAFAKNYFNSDINKMTDCLKDCHNLHKWKTIERQITDIDFTVAMGEQSYVDVSGMGAQACSGGACELTF